jgi:IS30 family transposase
MGKHYQHLDYAERVLIQTQLSLGLKPASISDGLERSRSTVVREIRRNGWLTGTAQRPGGEYRAPLAERRARHRRICPPVERRLQPGNPLWRVVLDHLRQGLESGADYADTGCYR